jgi:hypothetical protein
VDDYHEDIQEFSLVVSAHLAIYTLKMLQSEAVKEHHHGRFLFLFHPELLKWLKQLLVVLGHQSEASPLVEEIKLLVVFVKAIL